MHGIKVVPTNKNKKLKALLVGSSGGHLLQLLRIAPALTGLEKVWVCFDKPDAKYFLRDEKAYWCYHPTTRNIPNLVRNTLQAIRVLWRERPQVVISSGAAVAIPYAWLGRAMGAKIVFIEAFNRIDSRSMTGRLVYPIAHLFCVQWESMLKKYPKAKFIGPLP
jgi:UDP-N-acetylglucosamine:LPS N-acetylglucosamine transferase